MWTLAILGATRGVGLSLAELALAQGHRVRVLVRDASRLTLRHDRLEVVVGDATSAEDVARVAMGCDAVCCAVGAPALSKSKVRSRSAEALKGGMAAAGVKRLVCLTIFGIGDSEPGLTFVLRYLIFPLYLRRPAAEHRLQEEILRGSELDTTFVRPPTLTDGARTGDYRSDFPATERDIALKVSRADVAELMLRSVFDDGSIGQARLVSY